MELKEGDLVLCTVKNIEGATVFLILPNGSHGSMILSEVAAGRIRNLREYVIPNKKVVCKILKIEPSNIYLSLRRVTAKEREIILKRNKNEKVFTNLLKAIIKDHSSIIRKIEEKYELWDFYERAVEDPSILSDYLKTEEYNKLSKLILEKKESEKIIRKYFILKSDSESGIKIIKKILSIPKTDIKYTGSSKFALTIKAKNFKEANHTAETILKEIESKAKSNKAYFELKD